MTPLLTLLTYTLAATGIFLLVLWFLLWRQLRRRDPVELERRRRLHINRIGRIADGRVTDLLDAANGGLAAGARQLVVYRYRVRGVEYQAAQDVTFLGRTPDLQQVAAGLSTRVKYDPKNPSNSIILCEEWSGL